MLTRVFDDRYTGLRLLLVCLSGVGYLTIARNEPYTGLDWALVAAAFGLCAAVARWPLAGALCQAAVLLVAILFGSDTVIPQVGASWAGLELALRSSGWRLAVGLVAVGTVSICDAHDGILNIAFGLVITAGVPALIGANIRASRQLAVQAQEHAVTEARAAREGERAAIARELHDVVAHHVASIVLRVGVARHVLPDMDPKVATVLDDVHATGSAALADLRQLVTVLRGQNTDPADPAVVSIEPSALPTALAAAIDRARQTGVTVEADIDPELSTVDSVRGLAVLRLTQEALTNVARHAGPAARATVRVAVADGTIEWAVSDNGGGGRPAVTVPGTGHGVTGMRERVEVLGGKLSAGPRGDGPGWALATTLPARG